MSDETAIVTAEKMPLTKSIPALLLLALTLLAAVSVILPVNKGYISILTIAGYMTASLFHAGRRLTAESCYKLSKTYICTSIFTAVASIIVAITKGNFQFFGGPIIDAICGCIALSTIALYGTRFGFIKSCSYAVFTAIILLCLILLPTTMHILSGVGTTVIGLIVAVVSVFMLTQSRGK